MARAIGRGTWIDKVARAVIEREAKLGRAEGGPLRTESGLGASGIPHIGSFSDSARAFAVKLAIEDAGVPCEYIAFSDDMDGLRKVPAGLPEWLWDHLAEPVTSIPDPFGCHGSYGEHMASLLLDAMDRCGFDYKHYSAREAYRSGLLAPQIEAILAQAKRAGEIIRRELGQEKYEEVLPFFAICGRCGRIYTTRAHGFLPDEGKVLYRCEGAEIGGRKVEGCGYEGEADYRRGEGKLSWKVEFAARWAALGIHFEAYGKDIADSVRANDAIAREVLGYEPPYHVRYEMFLDKGGRKISKSVGNVLTPQVWLAYGSPQSLLLLMYKRSIGAREVSILDIPSYMDELDELGRIYFGLKRVEDEREWAKLRGLYEYCWLLKPPSGPAPRAPYNLLVYLARVAPKGSERAFVEEKLRRYGIDAAALGAKIDYAINWARDFGAISPERVELSEGERRAIGELIALIRSERDEATIQGAIFDIARRNGLDPRDFFKILYRILLGVPYGPRLGPYLVAMGRENVAEALEGALAGSGGDLGSPGGVE